jgi:hypothetical protein
MVEASPASAAPCSTTATGYAGGDGTSGNPFQIANAAQLIRLSSTTADWNSKHFVQTADIDLNECEWSPIGTDANLFTGSYNGSGFTIQGFKINTIDANNYNSNNVGFFGSISGGTIQNFVLDGSIRSNGAQVGSIAGKVDNASTIIQNVKAIVDITYPGINYAGGLVGGINAGTVRYSAYLGLFSASDDYAAIGSFTGFNVSGIIQHSYGRTTMSGASGYKAGMNGWSNVIVTSSYAVTPGANVGVTAHNSSGTVTNSFWDTTDGPTIARRDGAAVTGATGKTSVQLRDIATYSAAGWNIVSGWEAFSTSGTPKIWGICSIVNSGYPFLLWEYTSNPCLSVATAPSITSITASNGSLSVAFTAPSSNGGAAISNYKYSLDDGATWVTRSASSTASPLVITGLNNGTSYQVKLLAVNSQGDGSASSAVTGTPVAPSPSPTPSGVQTTASSPASLTTPSVSLASTGSNILSNWGYVLATLLLGLALVLISSTRRRETDLDVS